MNLLIVDDETTICDGTIRRIRRMELPEIDRIDGAYSGEEALQKLKQHDYQMMFSDIKMDGMDGLELIRNAMRLYPSLTCIIITAYDRFQYAQQAIRLGVCDFLVKPCSEQAMRERILQVQQRCRSAVRDQPSDDATFIEQIQEYTKQHLCSQLSMATVANYLNYSYSYFSRTFHEQTGKTFSRYLLEMKMAEVCRRLRNGGKLVDIAERMGYQNANNLTRAFTKEFGIPPSQWLKNNTPKTELPNPDPDAPPVKL